MRVSKQDDELEAGLASVLTCKDVYRDVRPGRLEDEHWPDPQYPHPAEPHQFLPTYY